MAAEKVLVGKWRMDTKVFLEEWLRACDASHRDNRPLGLEIFARQVAKVFSAHADNADYLKENEIEAMNADTPSFHAKVVAKCRNINASLKKDLGKTLPMPKKLSGGARAFSAAELLKSMDGHAKHLR